MTYSLSFLPEVANDAITGYDWYEDRSTGLGNDFLRLFYANANEIPRNPLLLELVESLGQVPKQYFKKLESTDDIWEVRVQSGNNAFRLLGFWDSGKFIILCHAFAKKTQEVPRKEIKLAEERKNDYFRRKG